MIKLMCNLEINEFTPLLIHLGTYFLGRIVGIVTTE